MALRRKSSVARPLLALGLALLAHALAIPLVFFIAPDSNPLSQLSLDSSRSNRANQVADDQPMEIETIVNQLDRPDQKTLEEQRKEEEAKKEEEEKSPHGQVVDIARPLIEQRPDKADYVSEYDTKVDRQTKGAIGRDQAGAKAGATPPPGAAGQAVQAAHGGEATASEAQAAKRPGRPGPLAMREVVRPSPMARRGSDEPPPQSDRDGELPQPGQSGQLSRPVPSPSAAGEGGEGGSPHQSSSQAPGVPIPNLRPTPELLQRAIGKGAGSMDYLKDVDDGDATALNSKRWKHAPFFNRIKRAVANEWHPDVVYVRHDPSGNVYGVKDRVTVLRIHLQPDGKLAAWNVMQSSGVDFLDDEAIDAFRKAQPFPNPPKELIESDGQIHFNFAFIFELSGHTSFKVYKYQ